MRRAARTDANHEAIVEALRAAGASVQSLAAVGKGCPDLLVGYRRRNLLMEVKRQRDDRKKAPSLTDDQKEWVGAWGGQVVIVMDPAHAVRMLESA
jgi:Holliday junction resolvase